MATTDERPNEGWGVITGRVAHYYRDADSLCRRRGFYFGPLEPETEPKGSECAECRRRLDREKGR